MAGNAQGAPARAPPERVARPAQRPARPATLAVAPRRVTSKRARRPGGPLPAGEVVVVDARELRPPRGEEPLEWLLLTSLPVEEFASACLVVQWYRCRGERELFFRVLKPGCQLEQVRLQPKPRVVNALAIYVIGAWRIHTLTLPGRAYPEVSCEVGFEPHEWQTLFIMPYHSRPPQAPPPLRALVRSLAQLGGF